MFKYFNPNPLNKETGDCTVRALCAATGMSWDIVFDELCDTAKEIGDMPSANDSWGMYLKKHGFQYVVIPDTCPFCYTIEDFCHDHPRGVYVLGTGTHVVGIRDGVIFDTWDSSHKVPLYYFEIE